MRKIKGYLGYTDNMKEPRKTNVEDALNRLYRYHGIVMNAVNFLCTKILENCYLEIEENYTKLKRNGEYTKPRTIYEFFDKNGETYFELRKTEYDFVKYLLDNGLDTEEKIFARDKADIEKAEAGKRAKEENKRLDEEKRKREDEEKNKFKEWLIAESANIPAFQIEIIDSIFFALYGEEQPWNYTLAVCINNYDKPLCKEEVKARLWNGNKASLKIFEHLTGLKLPKNYKDRMEYLDSITSADFKDPVDYKARKKQKVKKMEKEEFYILRSDFTWIKVLAEPIAKYGIKMFIFYDCGVWKLSHEEIGVCITSGKTKMECIQKFKEYIDKNGKDKLNELVESKKEMIFKRAGRNPRLEVA